MHTPGAQVSKSMHPAAKMCTQGAGCTLNLKHCIHMHFSSVKCSIAHHAA